MRSLAAALAGRGGTYVFISSVSAYSPSVPANYDESAPLAEVDDPEATEVTNENYGGLKVACERAEHRAVRAGHDHHPADVRDRAV